MKRMTLHEVQTTSLDVMRHIHNFCQANDIKYSLCGGSLIGAFRHKGFIPWDDDIDIAMTREDYDRFCQLYQDTDDYKLFCPERGNSFMTFGRLCEMRRTYVDPYAPCFTESSGIWIDIFPFDRVDDNLAVYKRKLWMHNLLYNLIFLKRYSLKPFSDIEGGFEIFKHAIKKLLLRFDLHKMVNLYVRRCKNFCTSDSNSIGCAAFLQYIGREHYTTDMFANTIDVSFEDCTFKAMQGYEEYLSKVYGDWREIPPVEKRIQHIGQANYWKKKDA